MWDIIVIGAGTAGLSAAIYGARAGKRVLVLEGKSYGGQIISSPMVENYPGIDSISGFEFATNIYNQALGLGVTVEYERAEKLVKSGNTIKVTSKDHEYEALAVVVATGAINRHLGLEREKELTGRGVSYCATCDGAFYRGKNVAMVGGGNTALEDCIFLADYCEKVYLIHRRDEFRGEKSLAERLQTKENVEILMNREVVSLEGHDRLCGIKVKNNIDGSIMNIQVEGLFIAVGQMPDNGNFRELIELDNYGYIVADESCKTNIDGIFVAGDCRTKKVRQLSTAAADGAIAGIAASEYINFSTLLHN